jgi:hypothetical protein
MLKNMSDSSCPLHHLSAIDFLRTHSLTNVVQGEIERMIVTGELKPRRASTRMGWRSSSV